MSHRPFPVSRSTATRIIRVPLPSLSCSTSPPCHASHTPHDPVCPIVNIRTSNPRMLLTRLWLGAFISKMHCLLPLTPTLFSLSPLFFSSFPLSSPLLFSFPLSSSFPPLPFSFPLSPSLFLSLQTENPLSSSPLSPLLFSPLLFSPLLFFPPSPLLFSSLPFSFPLPSNREFKFGSPHHLLHQLNGKGQRATHTIDGWTRFGACTDQRRRSQRESSIIFFGTLE
jgi:hypothetical protein